MRAADKRGTPRRAGMAGVDSLWPLRVRYRTADVAVRSLLPFLKTWIDEWFADIANGRNDHPEKTFAWS